MRKCDRYQSSFDHGTPGVGAAAYDLMLALMVLVRWAKEHELMHERVMVGQRDSRTIGQLLEIAEDARRNSIEPALQIYERLQQNEEAARLMAEATDAEKWEHAEYALRCTLDNKAIVSRGLVSGARREIERRAKETERLARVRKAIDDSPVECDVCGAVVVEYSLYERDGKHLCSSCYVAAQQVQQQRESEARHAS